MSPRGVPKLGSSIVEELKNAPKAEELGVIPTETLNPDPKQETTLWNDPDTGALIDFTEPPPPWEVKRDYFKHDTDARRFVKVPSNWELRWINPRLIDQLGWRDWEPVMASDPRVTVLVKQMISPENNIRRGGQGGDILAWMYKSWVESRSAIKAERSARQRASSVTRLQQLEEAAAQGKFGRYVRVSGHHPTHTMGEGKSMRDDPKP